MKYTPKRKDKKALLLCGALLILTVLGTCTGTGIVKTVLSILGMASLVGALCIFIRYEFTSYTYILKEKDNGIDFYIDKYVGRRGGYVCYFPLGDCVFSGKEDKDTRDNIRKEFSKVNFYNYYQSIFDIEKYILVFQNSDRYEAVSIEADESFTQKIESAREYIKSKKEEQEQE